MGADGAKLPKCSSTVIFSLVSESLSELPWKVEQKHLFRAKGGGGSAEEHGLMPLSHTRVLHRGQRLQAVSWGMPDESGTTGGVR